MRALVTGGTGFLGGKLVGQLLDEGADVDCLVRSAEAAERLRAAVGPERDQRLGIISGSLGRIDPVGRIAGGYDVVFHVAAALQGSTPVLFSDNVVATRRLIQAVGAKAGRFVLVSSLGVYGPHQLRPGDVLDEHCPLDPQPHRRDPYSYSKVAQEGVAWEAQHSGLPLVVVRPGNIVGPGRNPLVARVGLRVGGVLFRMGGRQPVPCTYVDNCARAVLLAGTVPGIEGQAFNIVDDGLPTGQELLRRYRREVGRIPTLAIPQWAIQPLAGLCESYHRRSNGQVPAVLTRYKCSAMWKRLRYTNAKAKSVLGWEPWVNLSEGLRRTLTWLREDSQPSSPT